MARECLVDGPVFGETLDEFLQTREKFISETYEEPGEYAASTIPEIKKIQAIEKGDVYLWFEEDLFCQVNFWFICSLLYKKDINVFLVLPGTSIELGFAGLNAEGLVDAFNKRIPLSAINVNQFAILWFAYQRDDIERLLKMGVQVQSDFPFVMPAIEAHLDRRSSENASGKPGQIIAEIMDEKATEHFATIFREFSKRAAIYGFGDLQVQRIYEKVLAERAAP